MTTLARRDALEIGLYALVAVVGGILLAAILEVVHAVVMLSRGTGFESMLMGTLAAGGVIEPPATKLVPALFLVYMVRSQVPAAAGVLHRRWLLSGLAIGLTVGVLEFATKVPLLTSSEGGPTLLACALAPAVVLHPLMGLLVAAPAFRIADADPEWRGRRRWYVILAAGVALAVVVHVWWNTGGASTVVGYVYPECQIEL